MSRACGTGILIAVAAMLMLAHCKPKIVGYAGTQSYGVQSGLVTSSYLRQIVANGGRADLCVEVNGTVPESTVSRVREYAQQSINEWARVLYGYADWPFRRVEVNLIPASPTCPNSTEIIRVHMAERAVWPGAKDASTVRFCTTFQDSANCRRFVRAWANPQTREIFLIANSDPSNSSNDTILHEMGHIMGLSDVYHEKGLYDYAPAEVNKSVMGCDLENVEANGDDAQGLRWVWDAIQGRKDFENPSCGPGYRDSGTYKQAGILYCVPTNPSKSQSSNSQSFNSRDSNATKLVCNRTNLTQCLLYKGGSSCLADAGICSMKRLDAQISGDDLQFTVSELEFKDCVAHGGGASCIAGAQEQENKG